jgi:hypothetical protein
MILKEGVAEVGSVDNPKESVLRTLRNGLEFAEKCEAPVAFVIVAEAAGNENANLSFVGTTMSPEQMYFALPGAVKVVMDTIVDSEVKGGETKN